MNESHEWELVDKKDKVAAMFDLHKRANEESKEARSEVSKVNLTKCVETRIKTSFIGALASFENNFGYLWGHGEMQLTEEQEEFRDIWQAVRKEILDKGNDQIKLVRQDLGKYDVKAATIRKGI